MQENFRGFSFSGESFLGGGGVGKLGEGVGVGVGEGEEGEGEGEEFLRVLTTEEEYEDDRPAGRTRRREEMF